MKKYIFTLFALIMTFMGASAQGPTTYFVELTADSKIVGASFEMTYQLGTDAAINVSEYLKDEVAPVPAGATVTLTVKPAEGYAVGTVTGETFMDGPEMRTRTRRGGPDISILGDVTVTQSTTDANVFTYTQPTANVRLTIGWKKLIQQSWITLANATGLVYDGTAKTPGWTVKDGGTDVTSHFTAVYSNNTNAALADATTAPTVTVSVKDGDDTYAGSASVTFAIGKKPLTITAADDSKTYNGTALTNSNYTNTLLASGDVIESVTITGSQTEVGQCQNIPSAAVIKNAVPTDVTANYEITFVNGTLTVSPATMTLSVQGYEGIYDGDSHTISVNGAPDGSLVTYAATENGTYTEKAPDFINVCDETPVYYKVANSNYNTSSGSATVKITAAPVTVTGGITAKSVTENGNTTAVIDCSEATITGAVGTDVLTIDGVTGSIDAGDANMVTLNYARASLTIGDAEATNYVISARGNQAKATISSIVVIEEQRNDNGTKIIITVEKKVEEDESVTEKTVEVTENDEGEVIGKKESEKNTKENADHSMVIKETTVVKDGNNNVIKTIESEITIDPDGNKHETTVEKDANGTTSTTCTDTNNIALSDEAVQIHVAGVDDLRRLADNGTGVLKKVTDADLAVSQKYADKIKTVQLHQVVQEIDRPAEPERLTERLRVEEPPVPFSIYYVLPQRHSTIRLHYNGGGINVVSRMVKKLITDAFSRGKAPARSPQADDEEIIIESGVEYEILTDEPFAITFMANEGDIEIESIKIENPIDIDGNGVVNAVDLVKAIAAGKTQDGIDEIVNAIMQK